MLLFVLFICDWCGCGDSGRMERVEEWREKENNGNKLEQEAMIRIDRASPNTFRRQTNCLKFPLWASTIFANFTFIISSFPLPHPNNSPPFRHPNPLPPPPPPPVPLGPCSRDYLPSLPHHNDHFGLCIKNRDKKIEVINGYLRQTVAIAIYLC